MKQLSRAALAYACGFSAAVFAMIAWLRYGLLPPMAFTPAVVFGVLAAACVAAGLRIKRSKHGHGIGQDLSQLSPVFVANWLVVGQASAWTGAISVGAYAGIGSFVLVHAGELMAAQEDVAPTLLCLVSAAALAGAGLFLEKVCTVDPPLDGEAA